MMPNAIVGVCAKGHKESRPWYWDKPLPATCDVMNRDERGAWEESYGTCSAMMEWGRREQCPTCNGLGWVVPARALRGVESSDEGEADGDVATNP